MLNNPVSHCPKCGTGLRPGARFCPKCGARQVIPSQRPAGMRRPSSRRRQYGPRRAYDAAQAQEVRLAQSARRLPPAQPAAPPPAPVFYDVSPNDLPGEELSPTPGLLRRLQDLLKPLTSGGSGMGRLLVVVAAVSFVLICVGVIFFGAALLLWMGARDSKDETPQAILTETPAKTPARTPVRTANPQARHEWLVMLYFSGEDDLIEYDAFFDANEAEIAGSNDQVKIVAQLDRYPGSYDADGDWTGARRYLLQPDQDIQAFGSTMIEDLGEIDTGAPSSLVDFATWAMKAYPSQRYALFLYDHGSGWKGTMYDDDPQDYAHLTTNQIDQSLADILTATGVSQFEVVVLDACLMGQLEVYSALAPYAHYAVGSEEVEPNLTHAYASFLSDLAANPQMSGEELSRAMVKSYIAQDTMITDDQLRRDYALKFEYPEGISASELAEQILGSLTMSAVDLTQIKAVNEAMNDLVIALAEVNQGKVAQARSYAQPYYNIFGDEFPANFLDLGHFTLLLQERLGSDPEVDQAAGALRAAISASLVEEFHGVWVPGSSGISFYFPNSTLYESTRGSSRDYASYTEDCSRFPAASLWDDFLRYHYTGQPIDPGSAELEVLDPFSDAAEPLPTPPPRDEGRVTAPGAGEIQIDPLRVSAEKTTSSGQVKLSTQVRGDNISYIYFFVMLKDTESDVYLTVDIDYYFAERSQEISGVYYPDWDEAGAIPVEITWNPASYFLSDGANEDFALFEPESYGKNPNDTYYMVRGIYTLQSGEKRRAVIYFRQDGSMERIWGYSDATGSGAPRQITPSKGDTFTILETWVTPSGGDQAHFDEYEGGMLTYSGKPFTMKVYDAYTGNYMLGVFVEDMDGNTSYQFIKVEVTD